MDKKDIKGHVYDKGVYKTILNTYPNIQLTSWTNERMPDYIWLGLILKSFGRDRFFDILFNVFDYIINNLNSEIKNLSMTSILSASNQFQEQLYEYLNVHGLHEVLEPLLCFVDYLKYPLFKKYFYSGKDKDECINIVKNVVKEMYHNDSHFATDVKYCVVVYRMKIDKNYKFSNRVDIDALNYYYKTSHDNEIMKQYRPFIRTMEQTLSMYDKLTFANDFWKRMKEYSMCQLINKDIVFDKMDEAKARLERLLYLLNYFNDVREINYNNDNKASVLLGLFSYSVRRFKELVEHNLFLEVAGRDTLRVMIETYINSKYLLMKEKDDAQIYEKYIDYGIGQFKGTKIKLENETNIKTINKDYLDFVVNDYKNPWFTNINYRYMFKNMREMAKEVEEEELYTVYEYISYYEHSMWGAIIESSMYKCIEPSHEYHWVIANDAGVRLTSVYDDVNTILRKHIDLLVDIYSKPDNFTYE